jgi:hypothetical protein
MESLVFNCFNIFKTSIEKSLVSFTNSYVYFYGNFFFYKRPSILSSKIICEYVLYNTEQGFSLSKIFFKVRRWQVKALKNNLKLENLYTKLYNKYKQESIKLSINQTKTLFNLDLLYHYSMKKNPIVGLRIECHGNTKKGRRSKKVCYTDWVRDPNLIGKMPNNTFNADIDYYQSFGVRKSSSVGIKVWVFFKTFVYNKNNRYISIVY